MGTNLILINMITVLILHHVDETWIFVIITNTQINNRVLYLIHYVGVTRIVRIFISDENSEFEVLASLNNDEYYEIISYIHLRRIYITLSEVEGVVIVI